MAALSLRISLASLLALCPRANAWMRIVASRNAW